MPSVAGDHNAAVWTYRRKARRVKRIDLAGELHGVDVRCHCDVIHPADRFVSSN